MTYIVHPISETNGSAHEQCRVESCRTCRSIGASASSTEGSRRRQGDAISVRAGRWIAAHAHSLDALGGIEAVDDASQASFALAWFGLADALAIAAVARKLAIGEVVGAFLSDTVKTMGRRRALLSRRIACVPLRVFALIAR